MPPLKKEDGRHARKARTAEAIISALHALLEEGLSEPTASQIAERADVAVRSIGQHFRSREQLLLALAAYHAARLPKPTPPVQVWRGAGDGSHVGGSILLLS